MNFVVAAAVATLAWATLFVTPALPQSGLRLSQKPTFVCETAQTSTERILCLDPSGPARDWELSAAKWARLFSFHEMWRDPFQTQHGNWLQSLYSGCRLRPDEASWSAYERDCVLGAYQARARLYRSHLTGDALFEAQSSPEQRAQLQAALILLGFLDDEADGEFGPVTRNAIRRFQANSGFAPSGFLSEPQRNTLLAQARSPQNSPDAPSKEKEAEQKTLVGTGFFVSQDGQVLTNAHVVDGCSTVTIGVGSEESTTATATVTARDSTNDLALIRTGLQPLNYASFRANARLGESVGAFGYPLREILSPKGNFTRGHITGITGLFDDAKFLQISAPIQLGNSGGPLVDDSGNVVGVVTKKLDAIRVAAITRDLAQNVNFAIKAELAATFLASNRVSYSTGSRRDQLRPDDLADHARSISVSLKCSPPVTAGQY